MRRPLQPLLWPRLAGAELLLGSADESDAFSALDHTPSTTSARNTGGDAASAPALRRNCTALREELGAQLTQVAGQLRRNAEHFSVRWRRTRGCRFALPRRK
ncbi:hypothetical protein EDB86DRAFT_2248964 [Lactarius hatsudake]|nr:hypothetical protein EDB86DRAFT_2248964 [Lactarius hatsudake]